jgi:PAS domain S-box-containing protein
VTSDLPLLPPPPLREDLDHELLEALVQSSVDGILAFDHGLRYTVWNPAMERLSGVPREQVIGRQAFELFPFLVETGEDRSFYEALAGRTIASRDRPYSIPSTGRRGWFEGYYAPLRNKAGVIVGGVAVIRDVTERQARQAAAVVPRTETPAEVASPERRLAFLAEFSHLLSASLDVREIVARLTRLVVPVLADYCILELFDENGEIQRLATVHASPACESLMQEMQRYPSSVGDRGGLGELLRTGRPTLSPMVTDDMIRASTTDPGLQRVLLALHPRSSILVPILSRGRILGGMALALTSEERRYGPADLALAEELGSRAALAIDNARLFQQAQQAARESEESLSLLAAADRNKDEFLAMLAHELRNPLAAIANAGHVLAQSCEEGHSTELTGIIHRQVRHLTRLVDDLLDVSRVTRGTIELRKGPVELRTVMEGAAETVQPVAEARQHRLLVSPPCEPLWLEADATRLEQVVTNLLHNAVKFTEPGGTIRLSASREKDRAVLRVHDTGAGIPDHLRSRIFDLFVQEDRSLARSHGGLGLGLTLVRSLVELHGGEVEAHSDGPGRGSEFVVRLPLRPAPAGVVRPEAAEMPVPPGTPTRVLVVEDNHDGAEALAEILRLWGHQVEVVHDGVAAVTAARLYQPDVILLDIGLPGMDGYQVAEALRTLPNLPQPRMIALTGYGQETDRRRSSQAGFDHHLVKPVDLPRLRQLLAR